MSPRLILFDIDCTLLWTGGAGRESTRRAMLEIFGVADGLDDHAFGGKTDWQTLVELLSRHGYSEADVGRYMPAYHEAMGRHLAAIIHQYPVRACPGALETVAVFHQRPDTLLGLVTGNVGSAAQIKLRAAGFDPAWFPIGAYGHEAMQRDDLPPLAVARAVAHYGHPLEPDQVIVIGDTPADVGCARALGAVAVAVGTGFGERRELEESRPDYLIDDLTSLLDILGTPA